MIRWFIQKDGSKVLQQYNYDGWQDVPEIDEKQESIQLAQEQELQQLENKRIEQQLKGLTYTIR